MLIKFNLSCGGYMEFVVSNATLLSDVVDRLEKDRVVYSHNFMLAVFYHNVTSVEVAL